MHSTRAFEGIENLFGKDGFGKIRKAHILIVGLGGVGSWVAESLVRSGVEQISLMDMDEICVSNINRQVHADSESIGKAKVEAMKTRLLTINPELKCHLYFEFYSQKTAHTILEEKYDFIVDAIDSVKNKALLLDTAVKNNIPILCIGGSGARLDPTKITINDLNKSINDKLLKQLKRRLRRDYSFSKFKEKKFNIPTVFSTELPLENNEMEECELKTNRIKNCQSGLGSASFVTASFGFTAVSYILRRVSEREL
ncbi:MAG: hypothetical protein CME62_05110 [Halobacteriovoraceae bacterium]|nr:hypothetical protein [Halobacteriovoraceae bacterium]|tara:strand:+ start:18343 stop:19107 length:765 start_codon:yes stop_codon:yes gene_type:complete